MIVDDLYVEFTEIYQFDIAFPNGTHHHHFSDFVRIHIIDNDGEFVIATGVGIVHSVIEGLRTRVG